MTEFVSLLYIGMTLLPCESCEIHPANRFSSKLENQFSNEDASKTGRSLVMPVFVLVLIVLLICALVFIGSREPFSASSLFATKSNNSESRPKKALRDFVQETREYSTPRVFWQSDVTFVYEDMSGDLISLTVYPNDTISGPVIFLMKKQLDGGSAEFNADASWVALIKEEDRRPLRRMSVKLGAVGNNNVGILYNIGAMHSEEPLQHFQWSPVRGASDFVFVQGYNVFYQSDASKKDLIMALSDDGSQAFSYGVADPITSDEIYDGEVPIWWSKSGRFIAYASFDTRNVTQNVINYNIYQDRLQTDIYSVPYPQAGQPNLPLVMLWIWDKEDNTKQFAMPSERFFSDEQYPLQYLAWAQWIDVEPLGEFLLTVWTNRQQNFVSAIICMVNEPCFRFFKFKYVVNGKQLWITTPSHLKVRFTSTTGFFMVLPRLHGNGDIYDSVAHIDISQVQVGRPRYSVKFHSGAFDVERIVGYNTDQDDLFFTAQGGMIGEMHLFRVPTASGANGVVPQCLTCPMSDCKVATPIFSPNSKRLLLFCEQPFQPSVLYVKIAEHITTTILVKSFDLQPNPFLPSTRFEVVKLDSGSLGYVQMFIPPNFDSELSYPVLLELASQPAMATVIKRTPETRLSFLISNHHAVVLRIDARGSGLRGWRLRSPLLNRLGETDVDDLLEATGKLLRRFPFLDPNRVSVMGKGYGGYLALKMGSKDQTKVLKCVVAESPITDLRIQNAAFAERYMGMPWVNEEGYEASSMISADRAHSLKDLKLILIHGLADLNVQFRHSAALSQSLQRKEHHFVQLGHDLRDVRPHTHAEVDRFLSSECFV